MSDLEIIDDGGTRTTSPICPQVLLHIKDSNERLVAENTKVEVLKALLREDTPQVTEVIQEYGDQRAAEARKEALEKVFEYTKRWFTHQQFVDHIRQLISGREEDTCK